MKPDPIRPPTESGPLRIALVLQNSDPTLGGLESWTRGLADWLVTRGHQVTLVAARTGAGHTSARVAFFEDSADPWTRARLVAARLEDLDVDLVHDTGTGFQADVLQPQTGSRLINLERSDAALTPTARVRDWLNPRRRLWLEQMRRLEAAQFADPDRLIAVSAMVRDQIAARHGLDARRITVIHNGVETGRFAPSDLATRRAAARAAWRLDGTLVFLLVANNFHLKGVTGAVRALARLAGDLPHARLAVVGSGDPTPYKRLARFLGVADRVRFLGRIEAIEDALAAADVALQPTLHDACSLTTLEGLASGLPTITTVANGAAELITEDREGYVVRSGDDTAALATVMARMADPATRERLGRAARSLALCHCLEQKHGLIEAFYRRRLRLRPGPR